ncbi:Cpap3-d2 [Cordylochernes scorpioides]|uniref:Cpap3-d2 n=1 Tax=Cordylochernes scorpioides TaxID=51811 RepID=A0ABY6L429_9ARAC|nr:Cpap3-d2 [Cordylochernes scorpioides]
MLRLCPNGLAFSGSGRGMLQHCDYPHRANCPDQEGRVMGQTPAGSDERCPWGYGLFVHKTSCTRYWQCWNGTASLQFCPFSLLYNDDIHACDWPDNVPECQQHPLCRGIPNGRLAIANSCVRYWQCLGGYPQLHRCASGLAFNPESLHCDWDTNVPGWYVVLHILESLVG